MKAKLYLTLFILVLGVLILTIGTYGSYFLPISNTLSGVLVGSGLLLLLLSYILAKQSK